MAHGSPSNPPRLSAQQRDLAARRIDDISRELAAGEDRSSRRITEVSAKHLTDDAAVDEEILRSVQEMRYILGRRRSA